MPNESQPTSRHGDASVVSLVVTMTLKPEREAEFLAAAREIAAKVHAGEPGVLLYALTRHPTEPHTYVWVERYADAAALDSHGQAPYMKEVLSLLPGWLARPPVMLKLAQVLPL